VPVYTRPPPSWGWGPPEQAPPPAGPGPPRTPGPEGSPLPASSWAPALGRAAPGRTQREPSFQTPGGPAGAGPSVAGGPRASLGGSTGGPRPGPAWAGWPGGLGAGRPRRPPTPTAPRRLRAAARTGSCGTGGQPEQRPNSASGQGRWHHDATMAAPPPRRVPALMPTRSMRHAVVS
jgi:hypothetical protein